MTLSIERTGSSRRSRTWLTVLGVLLLPAIIGGVLVAALQNPTERLDTMTAAVVNLDEPVTIDGQYTPLGRQLTAGLVEGSDELDSNLTWVLSNEDDAAEGLADGSYQAVITIPENFSEAATSSGQAIAAGGGEAEQATITVATPEDGRVADDLITSQIAAAATSTMGTMLSEATMENVLVGFTTLGEQIGEAADGATQLADGASQAADGASALPDGATQLADGVTQLGDGASQLGDGASEISDGASQLADGATQLGGGAGSLANGLDTIATKTREAGAGAGTLGQGLIAGANAATAPDGKLNQLVGLAGLVSSETATTATSIETAATEIGDVSTALDDLVAQCAIAAPSDPAFCTQLTTAATQAESAAAKADEAQTAAQTASGYATSLKTGVEALPQEISTQLTDAGNAAVALGNGLNQLAGGVDQSADGARDLASGALGLGSGAAGLGEGAGQLASGADELSSGAGQLGTGASQLADGATELADGLGELATGTDELAGGLGTAVESLPSFTEDESSSLASVIADPVSSDTGASTIFGPTAIPLLAAVVLWFGGLATFLVLRPHTARTLTSRRPSIALALRAFAPAALIGAGQGVLVSIIVQIVAQYDAADWWAFAGTAVLAGVSFAAVNQALVAVLGGAGRWISALVGVLAIATGLISTVPAWLASLGASLPTQAAFTGLISANGAAVASLIVWGVLALGVTTLAVALRRTTSAKAVLAV
ncbi:YhgE/Pip domain-containing protein [Microbacterium sp. M28]|uniref:YhgE/Pip domain-containing protein n=1 Tax=Microbacterium sp. M28 TaxID=2962064 RepID=UPI0021F4F79F|nr:YhgE/Pip domain-containing protein [Microbacterium sp. M28]UYO96426.1 YhgE/Pip domain-containing protein [Microbacterium sp. M28]